MVKFSDFYKNKKILITGNTGFKGSWLSIWLHSLGAELHGLSKDIPSEPSMYQQCKLDKIIKTNFFDIQDTSKVNNLISNLEPDIIFHMAAQAIVSRSYSDPIDTLKTNAIGTANICDSLAKLEKKCTCVIITSDKCYENVEWNYGYRENDRLGGKDVYSSSKACAELIYHSYFNSFLEKKKNILSCTTRAGNVLGGGDWSKDRIIVDTIKSWHKKDPVEVRSPDSTRPWQHVLEPLSGYLLLGIALNNNVNLDGSNFNFGPKSEQNRTVIELIEDLFKNISIDLNCKKPYKVTSNDYFDEAKLLKLCCDNALIKLKWQSTLDYGQTVVFIADWYKQYLNGENNFLEKTLGQIEKYQKIARKQGKYWAS